MFLKASPPPHTYLSLYRSSAVHESRGSLGSLPPRWLRDSRKIGSRCCQSQPLRRVQGVGPGHDLCNLLQIYIQTNRVYSPQTGPFIRLTLWLTFLIYFLQGTDVYTLLCTVHRETMNFATPYKFNPNHFLDENGQFKKNDAFMAFSVGGSTYK